MLLNHRLRPFDRVARRLRALGLRIERAALATRIRDLRALVDAPHDLADAARARIDRLARRERALARLIGAPARS